MADFATIDRLIRLAPTVPRIPPCRCCGGTLGIMDGITDAVRDGVGIHTRCIPKHGGKHMHGRNAARCREYGGR